MDTQTLTPGSSGPFSTYPAGGSSGGGGGGKSPILIVLLILLGLGTIGFGILTVTFAGKATKATKTAAAQKATIEAKAREDQKKLDDDANAKANESPFRTYTAPQQFGSFVISFPKDWSTNIDEEPSGTQVSLVLNPESIRRVNGVNAVIATKVNLFTTPKERYMAAYASPIKTGKIKQVETTVSGQPAIDLTGIFPDPKLVRMVVVPIRDKVLVFSTENAKYASEFSQILAQATIIP